MLHPIFEIMATTSQASTRSYSERRATRLRPSFRSLGNATPSTQVEGGLDAGVAHELGDLAVATGGGLRLDRHLHPLLEGMAIAEVVLDHFAEPAVHRLSGDVGCKSAQSVVSNAYEK